MRIKHKTRRTRITALILMVVFMISAFNVPVLADDTELSSPASENLTDVGADAGEDNEDPVEPPADAGEDNEDPVEPPADAGEDNEDPVEPPADAGEDNEDPVEPPADAGEDNEDPVEPPADAGEDNEDPVEPPADAGEDNENPVEPPADAGEDNENPLSRLLILVRITRTPLSLRREKILQQKIRRSLGRAFLPSRSTVSQVWWMDNSIKKGKETASLVHLLWHPLGYYLPR